MPRAVGTLRQALAEPIEQWLPRVGTPVLVIRGDHDRLSSLEWAGRLAGLSPDDHYPRHFRALTGFHRELSRLPRLPELPSLDWHDARQYLAARAAAHGMSFGPEGLPG